MTQDAPRTMTLAGLQFLQALASKRQSGSYLEVGPLFGSSTNAINAGRQDDTVAIHTIDTFEAAPWVRERLGIDLSRAAFDQYTQNIQNLHVYEGFAPDVVKNNWSDAIGFYFDDATHGDPGWTNNYTFFSQFFTQDAIICGDDFASGWPDIVRNVYDITERGGMTLFVIGRVWAFTARDDHRISEAIHEAFPKLRAFELEVTHDATPHRNVAASWSWGLHKPEAIKQTALHAPKGFTVDVAMERHDGSQSRVCLGQEPWSPQGAKSLAFSMPEEYTIQFCVKSRDGKTRNTKDFRDGTHLGLEPGDAITALRLSHL